MILYHPFIFCIRIWYHLKYILYRYNKKSYRTTLRGDKKGAIIMIERKKIDTYLVEVESKLSELEDVRKEFDAHASKLVSKGVDQGIDTVVALTEMETLNNRRESLVKEITYTMNDLNQLILAYENTNDMSNYYVSMEFKCNVLTKFDNALLKAKLLGV